MSNMFGGQGVGTNYRGNNAVQPPNWTFKARDPLSSDCRNVSLGDLWMNTDTEEVWVLVSLAGTPPTSSLSATWASITGSSGTVQQLTTDAGTAVPTAGNINVVGGSNMNTAGATDTVTVNLDNTVAITGAFSAASVTTIAGGDIIADGDIIAGGAITAIAGNITASAGDIQTAVGDILSGGIVRALTNVTALTGAVSAATTVTAGTTMTAGTGITATTGNITASAGNVVITAGNLIMPTSYNSGGTSGVIKFGSNRLLTTNGADNVFLGLNTGNTTMTGVNNTLIGNNNLISGTTSSDNLLVGNQMIITATTQATGNTAVGHSALNISLGTGNAVLGNSSMARATTASLNTVLGNGAGSFLTTGSANILIGYSAGNGYTSSETNNIVIGDIDATVGESNVIRIGSETPGPQTKCFILGIRGITTGVNDAIAVLIDSAGQLGTVSSSRRFKDDIQDMGGLSSNVLNLRPVTFTFKSDSSKSMQYGLIAEEVAEIMPRLAVKDEMGIPSAVKYHDLPVLLLNEIKKLSARITELEKNIK